MYWTIQMLHFISLNRKMINRELNAVKRIEFKFNLLMILLIIYFPSPSFSFKSNQTYGFK